MDNKNKNKKDDNNSQQQQESQIAIYLDVFRYFVEKGERSLAIRGII